MRPLKLGQWVRFALTPAGEALLAAFLPTNPPPHKAPDGAFVGLYTPERESAEVAHVTADGPPQVAPVEVHAESVTPVTDHHGHNLELRIDRQTITLRFSPEHVLWVEHLVEADHGPRGRYPHLPEGHCFRKPSAFAAKGGV